ncbi:MAG TPA: hypothetical protein VHF06_30285 [Pseudonocardiaceae bacterium]|nr:hypothetical protein [Pseudonocardiaceae bacterium]
MIIMHRMFQREIGQAPALIRGVAAGDVERAEIVADHVALVADILFHHHHAEDTHDVTPERIPLIFGLMAYDGEPDVVREAIAHMPPEIAPVMLDIAGKAFAEHSLRVHGTATPPHVTANRPQ